TATDAGSGVASRVYEYSPAGENQWTPAPAAWDTTTVADGVYDLHVVVTDAAGNQTVSDPVTDVRVDNTPPTATIASPRANVRCAVSLTSTQDDTGSGVDTVQYEYAHAGQDDWAQTPASWATGAVTDGLYDLHVVVRDVAGNVRTSDPVRVRVDNTPPTV